MALLHETTDLLHMYLLLRTDAKYLRYMADELQKHITEQGIEKVKSVCSETNNNTVSVRFVLVLPLWLNVFCFQTISSLMLSLIVSSSN